MKPCKNCDNNAYAKELCQSCYQKERRKDKKIREQNKKQQREYYKKTYVSKLGKPYKKRGRKMKKL